ncbi:hypothetical protein [Pseudomonas sp. TTU2014-080ASC]|uniref:hypothetical protein n=1 Tax=Pseudomonas sp. TTU2014-080ASC TaxID=1729724 RepID=UPI0007188543|nr:hypothetical protein [Pseudomonas sp. TTU2014-080ASC]KRW62814.1 hypothetical protein AO726_05190 [Pseudomonas sp. TTU2014-080ASC]
MKTTFKAAVAIASLALTAGISAAPTELPADGRVTVLTCGLLADDVQLTASNNVLMAFNCEGTANVIQVAACHTAGRTKERTELTPCDNDPATPAPECTTPPATQVTSSANIYVARSNGGRLQPAPFNNTDRCVQATVNGKIPNLNAAP